MPRYRASRASGAPRVPRSAQVRGGEGRERGAGAPTAASAPCAVLQPVGTEVYSPGAGTIPNPPPKPAAGVPESPSHPAAVETSLTPRRGAGTVGVGSGRVWKPVSEKGGDTGVLFEQGKAPLVPDLTTQSPPKMPTYTESGGLFLPGRKVAPSQAPRSLPSQGLRGPAFQGSGLPLCFSQVSTPPPSVCTHPPPPPHQAQIPFPPRLKAAWGRPLAPFSRAFWSTLNQIRTHPQLPPPASPAPCPSPNHLLHPPAAALAFPRRTASSHSRGFIPELEVANGRAGRLPPRRTEPQGRGKPSPTSHLYYLSISAPTQPLQAGSAPLGPKSSPL